MTAMDAVRALRERWWILLAAAVLAAAAAYAYVKLPWVEPRWRSSVLIQATGRLDYGNFLALEKELRPLAEQVRQLRQQERAVKELPSGASVMADPNRSVPASVEDREARIQHLLERLQPLLEQRARQMAEALTDGAAIPFPLAGAWTLATGQAPSGRQRASDAALLRGSAQRS